MASTSDIRNGLCIKYNNDIYKIIEFLHVKPGKGPAFVRTKLKHVLSGKVVDKNTRKGISHAYLSIPTKGFSSETNSLGEFKFSFPRIDLDSTVIVSVIGYKSFAKKASDFDSTNVVELEPAEQLASVQDILGEMNDLAVARDRFILLRDAQPSAWFACGWITSRLDALTIEATAMPPAISANTAGNAASA